MYCYGEDFSNENDIKNIIDDYKNRKNDESKENEDKNNQKKSNTF